MLEHLRAIDGGPAMTAEVHYVAGYTVYSVEPGDATHYTVHVYGHHLAIAHVGPKGYTREAKDMAMAGTVEACPSGKSQYTCEVLVWLANLALGRPTKEPAEITRRREEWRKHLLEDPTCGQFA